MAVDTSSLGRFSSQILTYLGTQRNVQSVTSGRSNVFKYGDGTEFYPQPDANEVESAVVAAFNPIQFYSAKAYFTSRGASPVYADMMAALSMDISKIMGISVSTFLENSSTGSNVLLPNEAYKSFNMLRSSMHQVGTATSIANSKSFKAKEIRA